MKTILDIFLFIVFGLSFALQTPAQNSLVILGEESIQGILSDLKFANIKYINAEKSHPLFITPVKQKEGLNDPGFYSITAYFDHDEEYPDHLLDYMCQSLTYDLAADYNHTGTDYFLWPYPWQKMYNGEVEVIAAAPGMIIHKQDGFNDQSCELNSEPWNGIGILHEDGSSSWYIHLKNNSLTDKSVGEMVDEGEFLGIVGSSGSSMAPHLHFEVYDTKDNLIDPFVGDCNVTTTDSWWQDQEPYKKSGVNRISTNYKMPEFQACPLEEIPNESNSFGLNDTVFLLSYFKNIFQHDTIKISVFRPDQSLYTAWEWVYPLEFATASWTWFYIVPGENDPSGDWTYRLDYKGENFEHIFHYNNPQDIGENLNTQMFSISPNPVLDILFINTDFGISSYCIYNMAGDIVLRNGDSVFNEIEVSSLSNGIYLLEIISPAGQQTIRFLKK